MNANSNNSKNVAITTSPELIRLLGKKLYTNNSMVILARELLQNSRDATMNGGRIDMAIGSLVDGNVTITCDDTGIGMDENTLLNVFLAIGKTGKADTANAVGGFGVAKVSLFCQDKWAVHTRDNEVSCEGNNSPSFSKVKKVKGTKVTAMTHLDVNTTSVSYVVSKSTLFILSSSVKNLWLNGDKVRAYVGRKTLYYDGDCKVSTAPSIKSYGDYLIEGYVFYRIRGLTQYYSTISGVSGFNVIVDFDNIAYRPTDDRYPFSMSRERVEDKYNDLVGRLVAPLIKNTISSRMEHSGTKPVKERVKVSKATKRIVVEAPRKNKGEGKITTTHRRILKVWETVFESMGIKDANFGLTYDVDTLGEHRYHNGQEYFLVNGKMVEEFIKRYYMDEDTVAFCVWMFHLACHELAHRDRSDHDENFTSREGEIASKYSPKTFAHLDDIRFQARKVLRSIYKRSGE